MKARIIERIAPNGVKTYVIQQRHFLFRWWWVDAMVNSIHQYGTTIFSDLESAKDAFCWYDGTKTKERVVYP